MSSPAVPIDGEGAPSSSLSFSFSPPPLPPPPAAAVAAVAPLEDEGRGHAPHEVQPHDVPSHPCSAQVEVDHHGNRNVFVVVVTAAVVAAAGRHGRRRRFHRPSDEPLHFFAARGPMRNVRWSPVRNSPRSLVAAASPPPPRRRRLSSPPRRRRRRRRPAQRRCREGPFFGRRCTPPSPPLQFSQLTNPPNFLFARLIFQSGSYNFSTPNFPLTKKKVVKTTLCTTGGAQLPPKY